MGFAERSRIEEAEPLLQPASLQHLQHFTVWTFGEEQNIEIG